MNKESAIICVDDEREVLDSVVRDLEFFSDLFNIEECESANECLELLEEFDENQEYVALLISDHVMPEKSGVELLTEVELDSRFLGTKKLLLTGLATQADTIRAINTAKLDNFFTSCFNFVFGRVCFFKGFCCLGKVCGCFYFQNYFLIR